MLITGYYYSNKLNKFMGTTSYVEYHKYIPDFVFEDSKEMIINLENILHIKRYLDDDIKKLRIDSKNNILPINLNPMVKTIMGEAIILNPLSRIDKQLLFKINFYNFIEDIITIENAVLYFFYSSSNAMPPNRLLELFQMNAECD